MTQYYNNIKGALPLCRNGKFIDGQQSSLAAPITYPGSRQSLCRFYISGLYVPFSILFMNIEATDTDLHRLFVFALVYNE